MPIISNDIVISSPSSSKTTKVNAVSPVIMTLLPLPSGRKNNAAPRSSCVNDATQGDSNETWYRARIFRCRHDIVGRPGAGGRSIGLRFRLELGGLWFGRRYPRRLGAGADNEDQGGHRNHADAGAHP